MQMLNAMAALCLGDAMCRRRPGHCHDYRGLTAGALITEIRLPATQDGGKPIISAKYGRRENRAFDRRP